MDYEKRFKRYKKMKKEDIEKDLMTFLGNENHLEALEKLYDFIVFCKEEMGCENYLFQKILLHQIEVEMRRYIGEKFNEEFKVLIKETVDLVGSKEI